jgi:hypothetical protein
MKLVVLKARERFDSFSYLKVAKPQVDGEVKNVKTEVANEYFILSIIKTCCGNTLIGFGFKIGVFKYNFWITSKFFNFKDKNNLKNQIIWSPFTNVSFWLIAVQP